MEKKWNSFNRSDNERDMANIEKPSIQYESVYYDMNYLRTTKNRKPRPYIKKGKPPYSEIGSRFSRRIFHRFPLCLSRRSRFLNLFSIPPYNIQAFINLQIHYSRCSHHSFSISFISSLPFRSIGLSDRLSLKFNSFSIRSLRHTPIDTSWFVSLNKNGIAFDDDVA